MPRLAAVVLALACARAAGAQSLPPEEAKSEIPQIQDNSFLMEEAYNQEEGVVQHINSFQVFRGGAWVATFTQEWPVPRQAHQLSYTILYARVEGASQSRTGLGDIALNYRYQLVGNSEARFAVAPRVSFLLPTGDQRKDLGAGGIGFQTNIAMSTVLSQEFIMHTNIGGTWNPRAKDAAGDVAATLGWNLGQSFIWLARSNFNVLVETVWYETQGVVGRNRAAAAHAFLVSPGIRWAYNFPTGLQIVPGIAAPIGVGPSRGQRSLFLYLSFEHPMWKASQ
ncbi:MAG TPA: transporter [Thermoanaerobaculia bacterium]|nr:transporter [Thermoanaerobaculia bacterium]